MWSDFCLQITNFTMSEYPKLYNLVILEELGDPSAILEVLSMFFDSAPNDIQELEKLFVEKKAIPLSQLAHKIKTVVSLLQSFRLIDLLKTIETRTKETGDVAIVAKEVAEVVSLFAELEKQLHQEWERLKKEQSTHH